MSPPVTRINTFIEKSSNPIVEPISKVFIIANLIFGVNRLPVICPSNISTVLSFIYVISKYVLLTYFTIANLQITSLWISLLVIDYIHYFNCTVLGFMLHKILAKFYLHLNKIDNGLRIKVTTFGVRETVYNFLQLLLTVTVTIILNISNRAFGIDVIGILIIMSVKFMSFFELHYYGHLFGLMIPRLKAMINCMKTAYPGNRTKLAMPSDVELVDEGTKSHLNMNKFMDIYNNIINAYDDLNDAIKWQMLSHLISIFIITLCLIYTDFKTIIWDDRKMKDIFILTITLAIIQLLPLLAPCIFADRVQKEVRVIRDFLACKLYENKLDKPSRSTARSLLALINTRSLSFSLFHMFDIDISLPIKFTALLFTYLIILLQFDKIISPTQPT